MFPNIRIIKIKNKKKKIETETLNVFMHLSPQMNGVFLNSINGADVLVIFFLYCGYSVDGGDDGQLCTLFSSLKMCLYRDGCLTPVSGQITLFIISLAVC